jgi:hypothetical protein
MEFCTPHELVNQTGHAVYDWPLVVLKELTDNSLDACEESGIAPIISVEVKGDKIIIVDNGPGIPASVIDVGARLFHSGIEPRGVLQPDPWSTRQCAQDHPADGLRAR